MVWPVVMANAADLSVRQLQYVVAVADTLGFHRAAAKCHVSQPALSAQIQQVESVLGVALFERGSRRVLVTAAGRDVVARARRILLELREEIQSFYRGCRLSPSRPIRVCAQGFGRA